MGPGPSPPSPPSQPPPPPCTGQTTCSGCHAETYVITTVTDEYECDDDGGTWANGECTATCTWINCGDNVGTPSSPSMGGTINQICVAGNPSDSCSLPNFVYSGMPYGNCP